MIGATWFQAILQALGAALAAFYSVVGNYGLSIILFTLAIRLVLVPLGIKQIKSMREMQSIQPKIKALQQKFKGNRAKLNEETMKLYKEHGVNPLMGCLPLLAQFPVLIALFAVLQFPKGVTHIPHSTSNPVVGQPQDSKLYVDIIKHQSEGKTRFLGANLLCNATQAGQQVKVDSKHYHVPDARNLSLDCGKGAASRFPYYIFALAMIGTTYYQQRQMQQATPQGSQQQQALTKFMPLLFGFWGLIFPAGLVIYWTTTNLVQIGQQHFMLPRMQQPAATAKSSGDGAGRRTSGPGAARSLKPGPQRDSRPGAGEPRRVPGQPKPEGRNRQQHGTPRPPGSEESRGGSAGASGGGEAEGAGRDGRTDRTDRTDGVGGSGRAGRAGRGGGSGGGRDGGSRKKRRKR
jgi:YidC/Oxa1 family membrane protein insertase